MFGVREIPGAMKGIQAVSRTSFWKNLRGVKLRPHLVSSQIKLRVMDSFCTQFWGVHGHPAQPFMAECYSSSNPPERKVNTDGSVAIEAAAAAIARDFIGHPLWAFRKTVEWREIWKVELCVVCHTVEMASRMGIRSLWVESDSLYAVKMINSRCKPHWEARNKYAAELHWKCKSLTVF